MDFDRRQFIGTIAAIEPALLAGRTDAKANASLPASRSPRPVDVRDYGAVGDGVTDDTDAFNRATRATDPWSRDLEYAIWIPSGRYRIAGTVYTRKGQTIYGEGLSTVIDASRVQASTFVLGKRKLIDGAEDDPGGSPVKIANIFGLGGAAEHGFIYTNVPGFAINGLFLSATGIGIAIEAADGIISDVAIDMCLNGIVIRNSQNIVITNLNVYWPNYGMTFLGECRDISISNAIFCYTKYASVTITDTTIGSTSLNFNSCIFTNNVQYDTFEGYIYNRSSKSSALFSSCIFRNWPRYAINQGSGTELSLSFNSCIFDGERTNKVYDQGTTSSVADLHSGYFAFNNCEFKNLAGPIAQLSVDVLEFRIEGGAVRNCAPERLRFTGPTQARVTIRNVTGFPSISHSQDKTTISLPYWGAGFWRVTTKGQTAGTHGRDFAHETIYAVDPATTGGATPVVVKTLVWSLPASQPRALAAPVATMVHPNFNILRIDYPHTVIAEKRLSVDVSTIG